MYNALVSIVICLKNEIPNTTRLIDKFQFEIDK